MKLITKKDFVYGIFDHKFRCIYIGSTSDIYARYYQHLNSLTNNAHNNKTLQEYSNFIGLENLQCRILTSCDNEDLIFWEKFYINILNPISNKHFKNKLKAPKTTLIDEKLNETYLDVLKVANSLKLPFTTKEVKVAYYSLNGVMLSDKKIGTALKKEYLQIRDIKGRRFVKQKNK